MPSIARPDPSGAPTAEQLAAVFDAATPLTVGIEEEAWLLDPMTLDLLPCAAELLAERLAGDARFKTELPAAQVELVTEPTRSADDAVAQLARARRALCAAAADRARPAAAGVHPFAASAGVLSDDERSAAIAAEYGPIAARQLVAALQVHVAVGGARRSLAVCNALRSYLPELAALAANGAFYGGRDSGLASVRPKLAEQLPRQGVPPALDSWEAYAQALRWGAAAGATPTPRKWWWELRPHPTFGTLELRVPDAQTTIADAGAIVAVAQALVARLAQRHDAGEPLPVARSWRIAHNRWSAARHGLDGTLADLDSGAREPTRARLRRLLAELEPTAAALGSRTLFAHAHALADANGAVRQRAVAARTGTRGLAAWMADRYPPPR